MKIVTGPQGAVDISKDGQLIARVFPQGDESDTFTLAYSMAAAPELLTALGTTTDLLAIAACLEPDEFARRVMIGQTKTNLDLIERIEDEGRQRKYAA